MALSKPEKKMMKHFINADYDLSTGLASGILAKDPDNVNALNVMAALAFMEGNRSGCENILQHILRVDPGNTAALKAMEKISGGGLPQIL